jgi:hypothetical protein
VDIYLLRLDDRRRAFFAEEEPEAAGAGEAGWLARKYRAWKSALQAADSGAALWARRLWGWLQGLTLPDESLLQRLRGVEAIDLHHPAALPAEEARALWGHYLGHRARRHLFWLAVNGLVCPLTVLLAPLPGPNVIGYWFVYRAACHLLIVLGVRRARRRPVACHPSTALDEPVHQGEAAARVAAAHGLESLGAFLERAAPRPDEAAIPSRE